MFYSHCATRNGNMLRRVRNSSSVNTEGGKKLRKWLFFFFSSKHSMTGSRKQSAHLKPSPKPRFQPFWADAFHPLWVFCGFQLPAVRLRVVSLWRTIWLIGVSILSAKGSSAFCVGIQLAIVLKERQKKVLGKVESRGVESVWDPRVKTLSVTMCWQVNSYL